MTPERIAELRALWHPDVIGGTVQREVNEMLDTIESLIGDRDRLAEATRWRDVTVEPPSGQIVLVWFGPGRGRALVDVGAWPFSPPEMWMPVPEPPEPPEACRG